MNTKFQISINKHPIGSVWINMSKWNKTSEVKPTEEKQYLCMDYYNLPEPIFKVLLWSNNFHEGEGGFYTYDLAYGYCCSDCDYWQEIKWEKSR